MLIILETQRKMQAKSSTIENFPCTSVQLELWLWFHEFAHIVHNSKLVNLLHEAWWNMEKTVAKGNRPITKCADRCWLLTGMRTMGMSTT